MRKGLREASLPIALPDGTPPGAEGHRERMRARLLRAGADALADYELLEMALYIALPRRDTKALARALLAEFGSFPAVCAAPVNALLAIDGIGEAAAATLKVVQAAALRLARGELADRPLLGNWDRLIGYLTAVLAREKTEQCRVLFLDNRNRLIADEVMGRGTVNHTPVYPREVVRRALEVQATALILVHNHPSGDPRPSAEDVEMTRDVKQAAGLMGITLHDHVIIGNGAWCSLRQKGLLG